ATRSLCQRLYSMISSSLIGVMGLLAPHYVRSHQLAQRHAVSSGPKLQLLVLIPGERDVNDPVALLAPHLGALFACLLTCDAQQFKIILGQLHSQCSVSI